MPRDSITGLDELSKSRAGGAWPASCATLLISLSASLPASLALAGTVTSPSASQSDVQKAIISAKAGDVVQIPAGTATWSGTLSVKKAVTLRGAGAGVTIVKDGAQKAPLINWSLSPGVSRLTGVEFQDGGRASTTPGILVVTGSNTNGSSFRMDHCTWQDLNGYPIFDTVLGVIDHCRFVITDKQHTGMFIYDSAWDDRSYGDGSWSAPTNLGSSEFLFLEDNEFINKGSALYAMIDAYGGARFVVRHNRIFNCNIGNHGTESTGRVRGGRAMEVYRNTFTGTNLNRFPGGCRSGVAVFHDNSISGYWDNPVWGFGNFRGFFPFQPWGGADGTNPWDANEPKPFFTGAAASNNAGQTVAVAGNPGWKVNQWAGYTVRRISNLCNSKSVPFSIILSNTSDTLTYADTGGYPMSPLSFCAGDKLEIRKVNHALDQPGRARGSLISGDTPSRPARWNDQVTEPCYSWNNGVAVIAAPPNLREREHYFNNVPMPGYKEYVYPHPLVSGNPPSGSASTPAAARGTTLLPNPWSRRKDAERIKGRLNQRSNENWPLKSANEQDKPGSPQ